jgi:translation initiation factor 4G
MIKIVVCRYDPEFLLQFKSVCKERPATLPPLDALDAIGLKLHIPAKSRGGSGLHLSRAGANNIFSMGNFGTTGSKLSSEEPYANINRAASLSGVPGMEDTSNWLSNMNQMRNPDPVAPLQASENRWDRKTFLVGQDSRELVECKVRGLLNKLTMEKFESISDQVIAWANMSEKETDGRTIIQVIRLVFENATEKAAWSEIYARLCRKMVDQISTNVQDDGIRNLEGKPITGGQLFRKYLLDRCQEDFEREWVAKGTTAAKELEDEAANAKTKEGGTQKIYFDEYYSTRKAKRQRLGLMKFIGELFKLQILSERVMHDCIKKLLGNVDNAEEAEIESFCMLLTTVGSMLDIYGRLDLYFSRMKDLMKSPSVTYRLQYILKVSHRSYPATIFNFTRIGFV